MKYVSTSPMAAGLPAESSDCSGLIRVGKAFLKIKHQSFKYNAMNSNILSSSSITGQNIQNLKGENIGSIKDLMIDPQTGEVVYAVMSFGGFLGIGDKHFAVPINALQFSDKDETIILDADKEKL